MNRNVYMFWMGAEYKLIKILRDLIYLHSKNGKGYNVHLINHDNLSKYIQDTIPKYFYNLSYNHQSDFIRAHVLCDHGGIYLDSDTIVMDKLDELFDIIDNKDGFFILENNETLSAGVFGSKPNTTIMKYWKSETRKITYQKTKRKWTALGGSILNNCNKEWLNNYEIFRGLDNMYPINYPDCVKEFINSPYQNYEKIKRDFQPLIILVNTVYNELEKNDNILELDIPLNYFLKKSFENANT